MDTTVIVAIAGVAVVPVSAAAAFWSASEAKGADRKAESSNEVAREAISEAEKASRIATGRMKSVRRL